MAFFRMEGVCKRYGGVSALRDANLTVEAGRIHAILGENGAGKSTLIKIMAGVVEPDEGTMTLEGRNLQLLLAGIRHSGRDRLRVSGTVAPSRPVRCRQHRHQQPADAFRSDRQESAAQDGRGGAGARGRRRHPSPRDQSRICPCRGGRSWRSPRRLARRPRILVLDEATSALTAADVTRVYGVLKRLRSEGLALLYISHRMHEIAELADDCTVFRNGRNVATFRAGTKSDHEVVELMIGREYKHVFPPKPAAASERPQAGAGSARSLLGAAPAEHLAERRTPAKSSAWEASTAKDSANCCWPSSACCGASRANSWSTANAFRSPSPTAAKRPETGMALIPEDRKTDGLMLPMSVRDNLSFAALDRLSRLRRHRLRGRSARRWIR